MIYNLDEMDIKIVKVKVYDNGVYHGDEWNEEIERLSKEGYVFLLSQERWDDESEVANCVEIGLFMR